MAEDPLVSQAFDKDKHAQLAKAIEKLSPDEAQFFLAKLEVAIKKRKVQITGYLVAMAVWAVMMFFGLVYYGSHDGFTGWVFLAPFGAVGVVLWGFGKIANNIGKLADAPPE